MPSRRTFLKRTAATVAAGVVGTGLYTFWWEPEWLAITPRELLVKGLPPHLIGKSLVQISDLHIGPRVSSDYILRTFARVEALAPDFVVMTGDWITYRGSAQLDELARLLEHFPKGKRGSAGILGNHDYGFGWRMPEVADGVAERVRGAGIHLLRDESVTLDGLRIVGLEDFWGPFFGSNQVLQERSTEATLVLSHNPDSADQDVWYNYQGWILSGHTHGGQVKPPFLPPPILPVRNQRYTSGVIPVESNRTLHISRGVGYTARVRFNARPEVTVFTMNEER